MLLSSGCLYELLVLYFTHLIGIGSPRVAGDEKGQDVDDIANEFDYTQGNNKASLPLHAEKFSSSSRHESQPISLLTHGHPVGTNVSFVF